MYTDTIYHYGVERKNHKYVRKFRTASGNWRYIYSDDFAGEKYSDAHGGSNRGQVQLKSFGGNTSGNRYAEERNTRARVQSLASNIENTKKEINKNLGQQRNNKTVSNVPKASTTSAIDKVKNLKIKSTAKDTYYKARNSVRKAVNSVKNKVVGNPGQVKTYNRNTGQYESSYDRRKRSSYAKNYVNK